MTPRRQIPLIANSVFIELARKRALYVVILLAGLFVAGAFIARVVGIDKPATGTFLLNLGLSLAYWCAHILTLILAVGLLPNEIENRTLYPLLAKPVARSTVLIGKWLATSLAGSGVFLALAIVAWIAAPKMENYEATMLMQMMILMPFSIALLTALAILCSLVWTKGVSLVLLAILIAAGEKIFDFFERAAPAAMRDVIHWCVAYVPDFSKLNLITRYTDGIAPLVASQFIGLLVYAALFLSFALAVASRLFERRPL